MADSSNRSVRFPAPGRDRSDRMAKRNRCLGRVVSDDRVSDQREAFEELWRREYPRVLRTVYLVTGDIHEAADVTQEAFIRAYERAGSVLRLDKPGAWVQRVAINLAISWRRHRGRAQRAPVPLPQGLESEAADPELMSALRALPPAQRAVIALRFYADQSVEDVARALHKRPGTVKALTHQAVTRLRELLREVEHDPRF
jgi:RNA polymerase sigma-70 factor (sigma-E family)